MALNNAQIERLFETVTKDHGPGGRIERMAESIAGLRDTQSSIGEAQRKVLSMGGGGGTAVSGWDGSDQVGLIRMSSKTKAVGAHRTGPGGEAKQFGEFLREVGMHGLGKSDKSRMDNVCKSFGSGGYDSHVVTKVPNAEGTGAAGGYLVPPQYYAQLLKFIAEKSFVKAMCTSLPMQGPTLQFPYLNQSATTASGQANFPSSNFYGGVYSAWSPEAGTAAAVNPAFKQGTLTAWTLLSQTVCSMQLIQDSFLAIDGLVTSLLTDSIAWQLDYAFLRGNGVGKPLGITNAGGTINAARTGGGSTFTLASVSNMISRGVMSDNFDGMVWVMSQSVLPQLIQMVNNTSSNQSLVWINQLNGGAANKMPVTLLGIPIYFTEKCPVLGTAGDVMLLDMTKYLCGDRLQLAIEASPYPYFGTYQMVWRAVWRGDGMPWFDAATTLADGTTTVSPHVILAA